MGHFRHAKLSNIQRKALEKIKEGISNLYPIETIMLYGSVARGQAMPESDIDLLIITDQTLSRTERHRITGLIFEVNLEYGTNFSSLVVDRQSWETGLMSILPIHHEIQKEGIMV